MLDRLVLTFHKVGNDETIITSWSFSDNDEAGLRSGGMHRERSQVGASIVISMPYRNFRNDMKTN
mgnify:CR=1 FL=1